MQHVRSMHMSNTHQACVSVCVYHINHPVRSTCGHRTLLSLLFRFQELFFVNTQGEVCILSSPPRRVFSVQGHSPDVVVCNLCHVLVGRVGVVHLPARLWFTQELLSAGMLDLRGRRDGGKVKCGRSERGERETSNYTVSLFEVEKIWSDPWESTNQTIRSWMSWNILFFFKVTTCTQDMKVQLFDLISFALKQCMCRWLQVQLSLTYSQMRFLLFTTKFHRSALVTFSLHHSGCSLCRRIR